MQHVQGVLKANRIDGTLRVTLVGRHDFEDGAPAKPFQGFHAGILLTTLCYIERLPDVTPNGHRKAFSPGVCGIPKRLVGAASAGRRSRNPMFVG